MPSKFTEMVGAGDAVRIEMPGGGGWGEPLRRDPARVLEDVVVGKISPGRARAVYGVIVDPERRMVDLAATERRRATMTGESPARPTAAE